MKDQSQNGPRTRAISDIRLVVGSAEFKDWKSWEAESDLMTAADAWTVTAANPAAALADKVVPGAAAELVIDGEIALKGYVDDVRYRTDGQGSIVEIVGRDGFAPLVDCSAPPRAYRNMTIKTLGELLGAEHGVTQWEVQDGVTLVSHPWVKIDPGDSVAETLDKLARKDGVLLWYTPDGKMRIGRPTYGAPVHKLRMHVAGDSKRTNNILEITATKTWRERYGTLVVAGASSDDSDYQGWASYIKHEQLDEDLPASRMLIHCDGSLKTRDLCKRVAGDEVSKRKMESLTIETVVRGHYGTPYESGATPQLYQADQMIDVIYEPANIRGKFWCSKRRFIDGPDGPRTELTLHNPGWLA